LPSCSAIATSPAVRLPSAWGAVAPTSPTRFVFLLGLPDVIELIDAGELSKGHGRALLTERHHDPRRGLARRPVDAAWSARTLEAEIGRGSEAPGVRESSPRSRSSRGQTARRDQQGDRITPRARAHLSGYRGREPFRQSLPEILVWPRDAVSRELWAGEHGLGHARPCASSQRRAPRWRGWGRQRSMIAMTSSPSGG
jgi:ParB-like protein